MRVAFVMDSAKYVPLPQIHGMYPSPGTSLFSGLGFRYKVPNSPVENSHVFGLRVP